MFVLLRIAIVMLLIEMDVQSRPRRETVHRCCIGKLAAVDIERFELLDFCQLS